MTFPAAAPTNLSATCNSRSWLLASAVCAGIALLIVSPFFWRGNASGHDIAFHASSWLDVAGQWKEGILFPRWAEWANYGFGEPRFLFYPPLSWMLGAALSLVLPGNAVPGAFIVFAQTLAGLSMFALTRRYFSNGPSVFAAACYAANPYALLIIYMRSDFAELLACALYTVLLFAALQLAGLLEIHERPSRIMAIFATLFAVIWLCNAPAGVMASYSMALLFAWAAVRRRSLRPLVQGLGGLVLGFGLTSFYLVPAAYEQRWVNIAQALATGLQPSENFLYARINDPEHNAFNWIASSVAILLMVFAGIAALIAYRSSKQKDTSGERQGFWKALLLLGTAATILMFRPTEILWMHLPKLRFVQFPWRWMGILALAYACFGAAVVSRRRAAWIWIAVVAVAVTGTAALLVHRAWWDSDDIPSLKDAIASDQGFDGTDEYDPAGDDRYNLPQHAPRAQILPAEESQEVPSNASVRIRRWTAEERIVRVDSPAPARLAVRLLNYPAWQVLVNEREMIPAHPDGTSQMILPLRAGSQIVAIRFRRTQDRAIGELLSGISVLVAAGAALWRGRAKENLGQGRT